jgi:choline dehydrogenase-like flavoprotein
MLCKQREAERERERERECVCVCVCKKESKNHRRKDADSRNAVRTFLRRRCSDRRATKEERTEMLRVQIAARGVALTTHPHRADEVTETVELYLFPALRVFSPFRG